MNIEEQYLKQEIKKNKQKSFLSTSSFILQAVIPEGSHSSLPLQLYQAPTCKQNSHTLSRSEPENNAARGYIYSIKKSIYLSLKHKAFTPAMKVILSFAHTINKAGVMSSRYNQQRMKKIPLDSLNVSKSRFAVFRTLVFFLENTVFILCIWAKLYMQIH